MHGYKLMNQKEPRDTVPRLFSDRTAVIRYGSIIGRTQAKVNMKNDDYGLIPLISLLMKARKTTSNDLCFFIGIIPPYMYLCRLSTTTPITLTGSSSTSLFV